MIYDMINLRNFFLHYEEYAGNVVENNNFKIIEYDTTYKIASMISFPPTKIYFDHSTSASQSFCDEIEDVIHNALIDHKINFKAGLIGGLCFYNVTNPNIYYGIPVTHSNMNNFLDILTLTRD